MSKIKKLIVFLVIMVVILATIPLNAVNAGITDADEGATTNSRTTLEKKETGTEEVSYDTNLEEYIANKKNAWINNLTSDPEYKEITVTKSENPYEIKNVDITLTAPTVGDKVLPQGWTGQDTENIEDDGTMEPDTYPIVTTSTNHLLH